MMTAKVTPAPQQVRPRTLLFIAVCAATLTAQELLVAAGESPRSIPLRVAAFGAFVLVWKFGRRAPLRAAAAATVLAVVALALAAAVLPWS